MWKSGTLIFIIQKSENWLKQKLCLSIWTKTEDLKIIELIALPFWDNRYR